MSTDDTSTELAIPHTAELEKLADEIGEEVKQAESNLHQALTHVITAGEKLIEAKDLLEHGGWGLWLQEHFPGSPTTARNYMRVARNKQHVADLPTVRDAVAMLAQPKPKEEIPFLTDADRAEDEEQARAHRIRDSVAAITADLRRQIRAGGKVQRQVEQLAQGEVAVALLEASFDLPDHPAHEPRRVVERRRREAQKAAEAA